MDKKIQATWLGFFGSPERGYTFLDIEPSDKLRALRLSSKSAKALFPCSSLRSEQDVATPQIQQRKKTKSEPPKGDSLFAELVGRNCNLINHAGGVYIINSEGIAYHQHEVLYIIKPQERCTLARDEIQPQRGW